MLPKLSRLLTPHSRWLEQQQNSILSAALIITIANIASTLSGLVRQRLLIASFFHTEASRQAYEAYLVASQVPDMMFQLIVLGALSATFIPIFASLKKKDEAAAFEMSAVMMNILLLIFLGIGIVVFIFAEPITVLRTGKEFTAEQITITTHLTRIMLLAQMFFAISNFFSGILQSYQRFIVPGIAPIFYNLGIIGGVYLLAPMLGIYSTGVGVVIGAFLHMVIQLPFAYKLGFRFRSSLNLKLDGLGQLFRIMPARLATLSATESRNLALGWFATTIGTGGFSVITWATNIITIPIRLFGIPISQASLPFLSEESNERDLKRFKELFVQSLHQIAFLALPASVLILILRIPIVRLIYGTNNFPWATTVLTGRVVAIISLSIAAQAMGHLLIRAFHALKDTKTPLIITLISVGFYLIGCTASIYFTQSGIVGIAIVTTVANLLELFLLVFLLNQSIHVFTTQSFWIPQIKMFAAGFFMAVFLYLPFRILDEVIFNTSRTLELIALTVVTGTIGTLVYIYFAALFEIRELQLVLNLVHGLGRWRRSLAKTSEVLVETSVSDDEV